MIEISVVFLQHQYYCETTHWPLHLVFGERLKLLPAVLANTQMIDASTLLLHRYIFQCSQRPNSSLFIFDVDSEAAAKRKCLMLKEMNLVDWKKRVVVWTSAFHSPVATAGISRYKQQHFLKSKSAVFLLNLALRGWIGLKLKHRRLCKPVKSDGSSSSSISSTCLKVASRTKLCVGNKTGGARSLPGTVCHSNIW